MINLTIAGNDVSKYLVDGGYDIRRNSDIKDSFENYDGTVVNGSVKYKTTITASLEGIPEETAESLSSAVKSQIPFRVEYSSPSMTEEDFLCTNFSADVDDPGFSGRTIWNIKLTLVSQSSDNTSGDGL